MPFRSVIAAAVLFVSGIAAVLALERPDVEFRIF